MSTFKTYPGPKTYTDVAGHRRTVHPTQSKFDGTWFYIYSFASCTDDCPVCNSDEQDDFCGERW